MECVQGSQKRSLSTPEHPQSKRSAALLASPGLLLSPASFSPRYPARASCIDTTTQNKTHTHTHPVNAIIIIIINDDDGIKHSCVLRKGSLCVCSGTPSQKYSQRGAKGEVVVRFGSSEGSPWAGGSGRGAGVRLELLEGPEESLRSSYKFMFQRLRDVRNGEIQGALV